MKKITPLIILFFAANFIHAQSFEKGDRIFDVNLGLTCLVSLRCWVLIPPLLCEGSVA